MLPRWRSLGPKAVLACRLLLVREASSRSAQEEIKKVVEHEIGEKNRPMPGFERYLKRFVDRAGSAAKFSASDVSRVLYVCSRMERSAETTLVHALEQFNQLMLRSASEKDLSLCLYCLSVCHKKKWLSMHRPLRDRVLHAILVELNNANRLRKCNPVDLTQILYTMAVTQTNDIQGFRSLCQEHVQRQLKAFQARECANTLWASTKLDATDVSFLHHVSNRAVNQWKSMKGREKSMTVWTWGCLGKKFSPYVREVLSNSFGDRNQPIDLKPQHYSNILVAMARLSLHSHRHIVDNLVERLLRTLQEEDCEEQSLANITWALGRLDYQNRERAQQLARYVMKPAILARLTAQGMCNVLMGWAVMGLEDAESIELMAEEVTAPVRLPTFNHQELSLLNWSFGKLKLQKLSLIDRLVETTSQTHKIQQFNEKQICAILQGWVDLQLNDTDTIHKFAREVVRVSRMKRFKTFELANALKALGSLQVQNDPFYARFCKELRTHRRISSLVAADVKHALLGFQSGDYGEVTVFYFFQEVFEYWLHSGKLHRLHEPDLISIHRLLPTLPHMDPALTHRVHRELERRKHQTVSL